MSTPEQLHIDYTISAERLPDGMITDTTAKPPLPLSVMMGALGLGLNGYALGGVRHYDNDGVQSQLRYFKSGQQPYEATRTMEGYNEALLKTVAGVYPEHEVVVHDLNSQPDE